jgi:membrane protein YqaA with SNARE-associated domain
MLNNFVEWTIHWADTDYGYLALFILAFAEASFFPVPPDVLLIALAIAQPMFSILFALICTVGSVIGGMFGYFVGLKGGKPVLQKFVKQKKIEIVHDYFQRYEGWAIAIAGFTPIPYKVFTIAAGVFYVDFKIFVLASIISRGARFFIIGIIIMLYGEGIKALMIKYMDIACIILVILIILGFYSVKYLLISRHSVKKTLSKDK